MEQIIRDYDEVLTRLNLVSKAIWNATVDMEYFFTNLSDDPSKLKKLQDIVRKENLELLYNDLQHILSKLGGCVHLETEIHKIMVGADNG